MLFLKKKLYHRLMEESVLTKMDQYQIILRALIQHLKYECVHDWRDTSLPVFAKYREQGKFYCANCGIIVNDKFHPK